MKKQNHMSNLRTEPTDLNDRINVRTSVCLPKSVLKQVKAKAEKNKTTLRNELMRGLKRIGYDIPPSAMIKDARRVHRPRVKRT